MATDGGTGCATGTAKCDSATVVALNPEEAPAACSTQLADPRKRQPWMRIERKAAAGSCARYSNRIFNVDSVGLQKERASASSS